MPIDFFAVPCSREDCMHGLPHIYCKVITNANKFGLFDSSLDEQVNYPAEVLHHSPEIWIATIINERQIEISFRAVDKCLQLLRNDEELDNECDCMLYYENHIIFIELKDNNQRDWIDIAENQLFRTICHFNESYPDIKYEKKEAYISNKKKINFAESYQTKKNRFMDNTNGFILKISTVIKV